jgi:hypothetical protein
MLIDLQVAAAHAKLACAPRPSGIAFFGTRPPAQKYAPNGRYALGKRTRKLASGASEMGQVWK